MSIIQALFSANGRMRRRDYWLYSILYGIFLFALYFVGYLVLSQSGGAENFLQEFGGIYSLQPTPFHIFVWAVMILGYYPSVCIMAKRFHDRNRTGWMAGVVLAVNVGLSVVQVTTMGNPIVSAASGFASLALTIYLLVELGCLDGTHGRNKYGPSPKGIGDESRVF